MDIPSAAWQRRLDRMPEQPGRPAFWAFRSLVRLVPTYFRLRETLARDRRMGRQSVLVSFDPRRAGPLQGVPLGGIGGGTVTRGWRGDFARWQLQPGCYSYGAVPADQFSVAVMREERPAQARVLYPGRPGPPVLRGWEWGMDGACATYHALFPRAWTTYENPLPGLRLTCRQVSPVIPHEYRASSLPAGVFAWTVENTGAEPATVSLMLTFQNGIGAPNDLAGGHVNRRFRLDAEGGPIVGIRLAHANRQNGLRARGRRRRTTKIRSPSPSPPRNGRGSLSLPAPALRPTETGRMCGILSPDTRGWRKPAKAPLPFPGPRSGPRLPRR